MTDAKMFWRTAMERMALSNKVISRPCIRLQIRRVTASG
jgi:hypothetical protein